MEGTILRVMVGPKLVFVPMAAPVPDIMDMNCIVQARVGRLSHVLHDPKQYRSYSQINFALLLSFGKETNSYCYFCSQSKL
jgi:hypothetical protein